MPLRAVRLTGSLRAFGAHVTSVLGGAFARARAACASCTEAAPAVPVDADQAGTSCYGNDGANTDVARAMTCVPGSDGANTDVGRAMTCVPLTPASVLRDSPQYSAHVCGREDRVPCRDLRGESLLQSVVPQVRLALLPNMAWPVDPVAVDSYPPDTVLPIGVWSMIMRDLCTHLPLPLQFFRHCAALAAVTDTTLTRGSHPRVCAERRWWHRGARQARLYVSGTRTRHQWIRFRRTWLRRYGRYSGVLPRGADAHATQHTPMTPIVGDTQTAPVAPSVSVHWRGCLAWRSVCSAGRVCSCVSRRLALLLRRLITWTSGEAYHPGPRRVQRLRRAGRSATASAADSHVNDVRFRFHNVQGLADRRFRGLYLERARATCDVLAVAEANWGSDAEARKWCSDWSRSSGAYWCVGRATARGMGIFFADSLGDVQAKVLWRDDVDGRGLAVQAVIHGRTTVIVAFHADVTGGDAVQEQSYDRLRRNVPVVADAEYVWLLDANNVLCERQDGSRSDGVQHEQTHPGGVRGLQSCLSAWGGLVDAYRHLHPDAREFTHMQTVGASGARAAYRLARRLDRIYVTRSMTAAGVPRVVEARHVWPTSPELVALKRTGSQSRWSDHAAVEVRVQYTTTAKAQARWTYPRHRLVNDRAEVQRLRTEVGEMLASARDGDDPRQLLEQWLAGTAARVQEEEHTARREHTVSKARVVRQLRDVHSLVGDGVGQHGSIELQPAGAHDRDRRRRLERERDVLEDRLAVIYEAEQQLWCQNRGYEEFVHGERCSRKFFDGMRATRAFSYIHKALSRCNAACTTTGTILAALRDFYCGPNGVFNLRHKYTARSERCMGFLDGESQAASVHEDTPATGERPGASNARERCGHASQQRCRAVLRRALRADGRVLSTRQRESLSLEHVFSPETVQQALDALTTETTPGRDGWPAHFFKVVGRRVCRQRQDDEDAADEEEDSGEGIPSPLAELLSLTFRRCADAGEMMTMMRDSTVSMIYKDKGKRCDLKRYRPIAVNSTLYRIMAKAIVVAMSPVLSTVTSSVQRAFKPGEQLQDNTRQVQDIIAYCAHQQSPGLLVFADQDGAYPRVSWDYLFDVMDTMAFPVEFISVIRTMYDGISLHFKVNGVVDDVAAVPQNGIAQGCPASPCLYLLCIQGFISLIQQDASMARGVRGIAVPAESGQGETHASVSAFADDLCLFLRDADQLPRFRQLLEVYEEGAGALNSWEKTEALRIGSLEGDQYLPEGWQEGRDISTKKTVIRYLGVYLGAEEHVACEWVKRTTKRMRQRADLWRERRMPGTRGGRGTALRNSILAQAWFLVNNQVPPTLAAMMNDWRRDAWDFYGNHKQGSTGSTDIRHDTLIQDYPEGGQRAPDVESFCRAIQVAKITRLLQPSDGQHRNFVNFWMDLDYGALRQGSRLLLSHCDFLRLGQQVPLAWRVFLKNVGGMPGFGVATRVGTRTRRAAMGGAITVAGDIPQHRGELTLGEILMEPVLLNPRLGGALNAANREDSQWEGADRRRRVHCQLMRSSSHRRARADAAWSRMAAVAAGGITHMVHIVRGWEAGAPLGICTWPEYRERARRLGITAPVSRAEFDSLVRHLPLQWTRVIRAAAAVKALQPTWTLEDLVRCGSLSPGTWVRRGADGHVGRVEDGSPCVLHAFSGKADREDGLARCLQQRGVRCQEIDTVIHAKRHDLLCDAVYNRVLAHARGGHFTAAVLGVPCSTFSAARIGGDGVTAPAPVRGRQPHERCGLSGLTPMQQNEVDNANKLVARSVELARAIVAAGGEVLFENPCDRGSTDDEDSTVRDRYRAQWSSHAPLWLHPAMVRMRHELGLRAVTFPQCALGGLFQKWTTLWYSRGLDATLRGLRACDCRHTTHAEVARGRGMHGRWHSAEAAAYPARMNELIADAVEGAIQAQRARGVHFDHVVRAWFPVDHTGNVDVGHAQRAAAGEEVVYGHDLTQVHVWERHELAACESELLAWERAAQQRDEVTRGAGSHMRMWCSGEIVDWDLLREVDAKPGTAPCLGSCNPAHWVWRHAHTDRTHEPTLLADVDTHTIYFMMLSRLYSPMRTLATGTQATLGQQEGHTTWVDLLSPAVLDQREFTISRIVADRALGDGHHLYKVRWEGFQSDWDTWEETTVVAGTVALDRYEEEGAAVVADTGGGNVSEPSFELLVQVRARMLAGRVAHGVNKLTAHKWESVLADAEPLGPGRCRKLGASKACCAACLFMTGARVVESSRHAHLECPSTIRVLALVYRVAMQTMATNLDARQEALSLSDAALVAKHKLLLVTGYRLVDNARGSAAQRAGDTPLCVLVAETHAAIGDRRKQSEEHWGAGRTLAWHEHGIYREIRRRMSSHIRHTHQEASRLQVKRQIDNPGKSLHKDGPLFDWRKAWVATGWATRDGGNLMPARASDVRGSGVTHTCTPWAWHVPTALFLFWYRERQARAGDAAAALPLVRSMRLVTADSLILYPDGSHDSSRPQALAGFGYTGVRGDNGDDDLDARVLVAASGPVVLDERSPVYLGADKHTNNTAELTALIECMRWAVECDTRWQEAVLLRPDSDTAIGWTIGDLTPSVNHALVHTARHWYARLLQQRHGRVYWKRVQGHSEHIRNDHVDALAKEGTERTPWNAVVPRGEWLSVRGDGELLHNTGGWMGYNATVTTMIWPVAGGWTIYQVMRLQPACEGWVIQPGSLPTDVCNVRALASNAVVRVERANGHDPFGVLNLMPYRTLRAQAVAAAGDQWRTRVRECARQVGKRRVDAAVDMVNAAVARLRDDVLIRREVDSVDGTRMPTGTLRCPVSLEALDAFIADASSLQRHAAGTTNAGKTQRSSAQRLARAIRAELADTDCDTITDSMGRTWTTLRYEYSLLGSRMVASGHVLAARETAQGGTDPFKYGRAIRYLALQEYGDEFDDWSCWPTALAATCPVGRELSEVFVRHKRVIYDAVGDFYFPNLTAAEKQIRMKRLNLRLDFDASIAKWEREWQVPLLQSITQRRCMVHIPGVAAPFDFRAYVESLQPRTAWIAGKAPAMMELVRQVRSSGSDRPEVTVKSCVLQECEGISRNAKIRHCTLHGHWAFSKQHDGVGAGALCDTDRETLRAQLEHASSAALGYAQKVTAASMPASMTRPAVPWERQWPYDAQKNFVDGLPDDLVENAEMIATLRKHEGPGRSLQWEHDTTTIMLDRPSSRSWTRSFTVDTWDDAAIHRLCMEARRAYTHIVDRPGVAGARTRAGHSTAWEAE